MSHVSEISVGSDGTIWCRDRSGFLYKREGESWKRNPTAIAEEVAVADADNVWCRNREGHVFRLIDGSWNGEWQRDESAKDVISISAGNGNVCVVNNRGEIFRRQDGQWQRVGGPAVNLKIYTVREGDTLGQIVKNEYGLSGGALNAKVSEIALLNSIANPDKIKVGDQIMLPL